MNTIEIDEIKDINNMALYNDKEITVKSKSNIFYLIEYCIEQAIHDIGLDKEISRFSGNSDRYREILSSYERRYLEGNIKNDPNVIKGAYDYIERILDLSCILYGEDKIVTYEGKANGLVVFNALYEKYKDLCSKYPHLDGFIDNCSKKLEKDALKRM
jgi:hypothetical protein